MVVTKLLSWYSENGRHDLPWRQTRDPYRVLVSELMLQQTQVSRVISKYNSFLEKFPTLQDLAVAERKDVLLLWQGLGYNSRAVRLHALAKLVVSEYDGSLPKNREELLQLPGIGPYTAGAIIIFSQDKPSISVDVNVSRVVSRLFWTKRQRPSKQEIEKKALELLTKPHDVHSALMDFGSSICTATPNCGECPLFASCKSQGVRPNEKKAAKSEKFKGSNRWWRGRILKAVLTGDDTEGVLFEKLGKESEGQCKRALQGLLDEGVIQKKEGKIIV